MQLAGAGCANSTPERLAALPPPHLKALLGDKLPACGSSDYEQWTVPNDDRTQRCLLGAQRRARGPARPPARQPCAGWQQGAPAGACRRLSEAHTTAAAHVAAASVIARVAALAPPSR